VEAAGATRNRLASLPAVPDMTGRCRQPGPDRQPVIDPFLRLAIIDPHQ
jgi:hypothetical protein